MTFGVESLCGTHPTTHSTLYQQTLLCVIQILEKHTRRFLLVDDINNIDERASTMSTMEDDGGGGDGDDDDSYSYTVTPYSTKTRTEYRENDESDEFSVDYVFL